MASKVIYQTLENRDNPDEIEENGPYKCNWSNTWLGDGYYFWDTFIENAHWWGDVHRKGNYIICEAHFDYLETTCLDLVGNTDHMTEFSAWVNLMKGEGLIDENTTVARVIQHLDNVLDIFQYKAIRVYGINSQSQQYWANYGLKFEADKAYFLHYKPAIQICIFNCKEVNLRNLRVVYPVEYMQDYVV